MDLEDIDLNFQALRKLYGLLDRDGDGSQNFTSNSNTLDDNSRLLLKHLLDTEAKNVLKAHSEVAGRADLSYSESSTQPQQLSDGEKQQPPALLNPTETSAVNGTCGNNQDVIDIAPLNKENLFAELESREPPFNLMVLKDSISQSENRKKCCWFCRREQPTDNESAFSETNSETKVLALTHQQKSIFDHLLNDEKQGLRSAIYLPGSPRSTGTEEWKASNVIDYSQSCIETPLNRPAVAILESESSHKLASAATREPQGSDYFSKEASDVITQIELCIMDLKIGSKSFGRYMNTEALIESIVQCELYDVMSNFVPHQESASNAIQGKSLITARIELNHTGNSVAGSNVSLHQVVNGQYGDSSPQHQVPSKISSPQMDMKLPHWAGTQPLKPLLTNKTTISPTSSQTLGRTPYLISEPYMPSQKGNIFEGKKRVDWILRQKVMQNMAIVESLNQATSQNDLIPSQKYNSNGSLPNRKRISNRFSASATWLPSEINKENLHCYQAILEDKFIKPGKHQPSGNSRVPNDYIKKGINIQRDDSSCKASQSWIAHRNKGLHCQQGQNLLLNQPDQFAESLTSNSNWTEEEERGILKSNGHKYPMRKTSHHQQQSDDTYLNSCSSSWRSQQTSTSDNEYDRYYVQRHNQIQNHVSPSTSNESGVYTRPHRHQWHNMAVSSSGHEIFSSLCSDRDYDLTSRGSNESGEYSLPSSASTDQVSFTGDSESKGYSQNIQPGGLQHHKLPRCFSANSTSAKTGSTRFHIPAKRMKPKKPVGPWKS